MAAVPIVNAERSSDRLHNISCSKDERMRKANLGNALFSAAFRILTYMTLRQNSYQPALIRTYAPIFDVRLS